MTYYSNTLVVGCKTQSVFLSQLMVKLEALKVPNDVSQNSRRWNAYYCRSSSFIWESLTDPDLLVGRNFSPAPSSSPRSLALTCVTSAPKLLTLGCSLTRRLPFPDLTAIEVTQPSSTSLRLL
ncbi:Uncharacterized protein HZ326_9211 [Fusarium oxysporum f. sp. albedinis]|nr:Uncharacterized protein HZ326_9211 [Fusarium oxysporum f. sp. albedinis]